MTEKKLVTFQAAPEEIARWDEVSHAARKSRSQWMRDVLNAHASGIPYEKLIPTPPPVMPTKVMETATLLKERAVEVSKRPKTECMKRLPKGTFCKSCGRIH